MGNLRAQPLTVDHYSKYGDIFSVRENLKSVPANQGTAKRFNFVASIENLRPGNAKANFCIFRCDPQIRAPEKSFIVKILEKHPFSTQALIPMQGVAERYLVVVALGKEKPDLSTLSAFIVTTHQGVTYRPGTWHHPIIAIDHQTDFSCLVWEDGLAGDCEIITLENNLIVEL